MLLDKSVEIIPSTNFAEFCCMKPPKEETPCLRVLFSLLGDGWA